jgi:hypothetical protein
MYTNVINDDIPRIDMMWVVSKLLKIKRWMDEGSFTIWGKRIDNALVVFGILYLLWCVYCYTVIMSDI